MTHRSDQVGLEGCAPTAEPAPQRSESQARRVVSASIGKRFVLIAVALVIGVTGVCYFVDLRAILDAVSPDATAQAAASADDQPQPVGVVDVKTVKPQRTTLRRTTTQPGTAFPFYEAKVYARVPGYLKEWKVDIGDRVEERQVLARIDVPELDPQRSRYEAEISRLQSEQAEARATVESAQAQIGVEKARVEQARAGLGEAQAQSDAVQSEFRRIEGLVTSGAVQEALLDEAKKRYEAAVAGRQSAESGITLAQANVSLAEARRKAAQASVETLAARIEVARNQLKETEALLGYATLLAPFRGVITSRGVDIGDLVGDTQKPTAGAPLFIVCHIDKVRLRVAVPEREAAGVDVGDAAEFRPLALPGNVFPGKVSRAASSLDLQSRTMLVEVDLQNPNHRLLPGMYGQVTLVLDERPNTLLLPASAIRDNGAGKKYVFVVGPEDKAHRADVTTGSDDGNLIEVARGLGGGERVIVSQIPGLAPGQRVRATAE